MYNFLGQIGTGKYSKVYKASSKANTEKIVAIKQIDLTTIDQVEIEIIKNETSIIKVLHHPNIVRYYETYETKDTIYIVCEFLRDGQLFDYVLENKFLEEEEASFIMEQLISTVKYLHNTSIIHRDLKPENILIEKYSDGVEKGKIKFCKLIDFGFACYNTDEKQMAELVGTPNYVAPEVYLGTYDQRCDNFSLGVILYFMLRGSLPFSSVAQEIVIRKTIKGDYQISDLHWSNCSPQAVDLTTRLLEKDPAKRISLIEALVHPFISERKALAAFKGVNRKEEILDEDGLKLEFK
jgi:calcium-dependent protein kinase